MKLKHCDVRWAINWEMVLKLSSLTPQSYSEPLGCPCLNVEVEDKQLIMGYICVLKPEIPIQILPLPFIGSVAWVRY